MENGLDIIYCGRGNKILDFIAIQSGFLYGMRLPHTVHFPVYFADQNWKDPKREMYMKYLSKYKPEIATVLDIETYDFKETLDWAEEASQYVEKIILIPKVSNIIDILPTLINGKQVILGYSVPTKYGKTEVPVEEFKDHPVHLLGGLPHTQMLLYKKLNVVSVDCNFFSLKANTYCEFWTGKYNSSRIWEKLSDIGITGSNSHYLAFSLSCVTILRAWEDLTNGKEPNFMKVI